MARNPRYHLKNHRTSANPETLYVCEECKIPKLARDFFRSNNRSGIKYSNQCRVCSNNKISKSARRAIQRLKSDPSYAMDIINRLGPEPIPIKDGWDKYNKWKMTRVAILAKAGLIDKKGFNIVDYVNRKVKYGRLTTTEAEYYIERYYERYPESRPKPEGGVQRPVENRTN